MARFDPIRGLRPHIRSLPPYQAIRNAEEIAAGYGVPPEEVLQLSGNENPYGPSPAARAALFAEYRPERYGDTGQRRFRRALARHLGVPEGAVIGGAGSDELIDLIFRAWIAPGDRVVTAGPTFGMYRFDAGLYEAELTDVPRRDDWALDRPALLAAARTAKLVILTNPNNPTGNLLDPGLIPELLDSGALLVVDEAYIEFADAASLARQAAREPALVVLRTFSKWAGLAGLRVGYAVAVEPVVETLMRAKQPYTISRPAEAAAIASLGDAPELDRRAAIIVQERRRLTRELSRQGWLEPFPSEANFVLVRAPGLRGQAIALALQQRGIFVRVYDGDRLDDCIRISVGLPAENDRVLVALRDLAGELGSAQKGAPK